MPIYLSVVCGICNSLQQNNMIQNASCFSLFRLFIQNVLEGLIRGICQKIFDLHILPLSFKRQQKCWIRSQSDLCSVKQKLLNKKILHILKISAEKIWQFAIFFLHWSIPHPVIQWQKDKKLITKCPSRLHRVWPLIAHVTQLADLKFGIALINTQISHHKKKSDFVNSSLQISELQLGNCI